jgi:hypothetical protein
MGKIRLYPKEWPKELTYLKSPKSNVVHLCYRHTPKVEYGMEVRTASPMCGAWCWKNVVPVLVEEIQDDPNIRFCKTCLYYTTSDFWRERFAKRVDYLSLEHCMEGAKNK